MSELRSFPCYSVCFLIMEHNLSQNPEICSSYAPFIR
jgi:hypothetical protein